MTRDRREGDAHLLGLDFRVMDTAGYEDEDPQSLPGRMRRQTESAVAEADVTLFLVDARAGVTPLGRGDRPLAARLDDAGGARRQQVARGAPASRGCWRRWRSASAIAVQLSAEHGEGIGDLFEALLPFLEREDAEDEAEDESPDAPLKLAIVGRPNAGKSTLVNRMLGEERMITGPEAGITRDSIATDWEWQDRDGQRRAVRLIDTAGMRKRAKVQDKLEKLSVADALHAVDFAEVVVLLLDATLGLEAQDLRIADRVLEEGRALVIALNKWDVAEGPSALFNGVKAALEDGLSQVKGVPLLTVSAATGKGIDQLMAAAFETREAWSRRVGTGELNRWFERAIEANPPPAPGGKRIKMRYVTQVKTRPPSFVIFGTRVDQLPASYERYLVNSMRRELGFGAVPVRITLRAPKNPFDAQASGNAKFTKKA